MKWSSVLHTTNRFISTKFHGTVNWFPGHMARAIRHAKAHLMEADAIVEVRDARIPFTSANNDLRDLIPRNQDVILVLNKADLANPRLQPKIEQILSAQGYRVFFSSSTTPRQTKKLLRTLCEYVPPQYQGVAGSVLAIVGVPNAGKSTLINNLRIQTREVHKRGAKTGAKAGLTRQFSAFKIATNPSLFLIDSPGMLMPRIESLEDGLKLALTGAIREDVVPYEALAEYVLHHYHKTKSKQFVRALQLSSEEVGQDIDDFLTLLANRWNLVQTGNVVDQVSAAKRLVKMFRAGQLGRYTLDDVGTFS